MQLADYQLLIDRLRDAGYTFKLFSEGATTSAQRRSVIVRHDVDFSLALACSMARREAELDVRATYFVHTRSPLYNVFAAESAEILSQIAHYGHDVALHFDASMYPTPGPKDVEREVRILQGALPGCLTDVCSLHRPGGRLDEIRDWTSRTGLQTTYDAPWTTDYCYFSDSGGSWSHGAPLDSVDFHERRSLQLLIHPLWWLMPGLTPASQLREFASRTPVETVRRLRETAVSIDF